MYFPKKYNTPFGYNLLKHDNLQGFIYCITNGIMTKYIITAKELDDEKQYVRKRGTKRYRLHYWWDPTH